MLSSDPAANPDLHTWNRVFVPYCSGDSSASSTGQASSQQWWEALVGALW